MANEHELRNLLETWRQEYAARGWGFVSDGVIHHQGWDGMPEGKRILFVLREANQKTEGGCFRGDSWSLTEAVSRQRFHLPASWKRVAEWAFGIMNTSADFMPPYMPDIIHTKYVKCVAILNLKKQGGTDSVDARVVEERAMADKARILEEIELIDPDVIVLGGTAATFGRLYGIRGMGDGPAEQYRYHTFDGGRQRLLLSYWHPANRYPKYLNYCGLIHLYRQALLHAPSQGGGI